MNAQALASLALSLSFIASFAGAMYGARIDNIGMMIGALPGIVALVGLCIWGTTLEGFATYEPRKPRTMARRKAHSCLARGR